MTEKPELYEKGVIAQLITMNKKLDIQNEVLCAQVLQLIEMNKLMKKLNYISGTDDSVSKKEIEEELAFLSNHVDVNIDKVLELLKRPAIEDKEEKKWSR